MLVGNCKTRLVLPPFALGRTNYTDLSQRGRTTKIIALAKKSVKFGGRCVWVVGGGWGGQRQQRQYTYHSFFCFALFHLLFFFFFFKCKFLAGRRPVSPKGRVVPESWNSADSVSVGHGSRCLSRLCPCRCSPGHAWKHGALRPQKPLRLIRDGEVGVGGDFYI